MSTDDTIAQFVADTATAHDIVHGDATTTIETDNGPVRSLAKLIADNQATIDAQLPHFEAIANGTSTDAGTLTGAETVPASRGTGPMQTTLTKIAAWVIQTYQGFTQSGTGAVARTVQAKLQDAVSVKDFGAVGDGVTDDSAAIQAAINANPGRSLEFPYTGNPYVINSVLTQATPTVSFLVDGGVTFGGTGRLPTAVTNSHQLNVGSYFVQAPSGGTPLFGNAPLQAESLPAANFVGNSVPFYSGSASPAGNPNFTGFIWGGNSLATMNPSTGTYSAIGWEFDLNNNYQNAVGDGILVTGVGSFNPNIGVAVKRANTTSDWVTGILIQNYGTAGLLIDGSTSQSPQTALRLQGQTTNLIRMTPSDDLTPTGAIAFLTNAAGSTNNFVLTKRGGVKIGPSSTEVSFWSSNTFTLSPGTIPANSTVEVTASVTNSLAGQYALVTPSAVTPPAGIIWDAYCMTNGTVTVRFANVTAASVAVTSGAWRIDVINH
jgi:hypothetical protein